MLVQKGVDLMQTRRVEVVEQDQVVAGAAPLAGKVPCHSKSFYPSQM